MTSDEYCFGGNSTVSPLKKDQPPILSNHTDYKHPGSESWEHDDTGNIQNYSGCYDDVMNPIAEHEGWQEGYDY